MDESDKDNVRKTPEELGLPGTNTDFVITHSETWTLPGKREQDLIGYARWMGGSTPAILKLPTDESSAARNILSEALASFKDKPEQQSAYIEGLQSVLVSETASSE